MLNAWLNKNDVAGLLFECKNINGFIDKREFVIELNKLKEYKKPKKPHKPYRPNFIHEIKTDILNYKSDVKHKSKTGYFENYINNLNEFAKRELVNSFKYDNFTNINIVPAHNLINIVKVSDMTITRWLKNDFIQKKHKNILAYHNNNLISAFNFYYYDLSDIEKKIKYLLSNN